MKLQIQYFVENEILLTNEISGSNYFLDSKNLFFSEMRFIWAHSIQIDEFLYRELVWHFRFLSSSFMLIGSVWHIQELFLWSPMMTNWIISIFCTRDICFSQFCRLWPLFALHSKLQNYYFSRSGDVLIRSAHLLSIIIQFYYICVSFVPYPNVSFNVSTTPFLFHCHRSCIMDSEGFSLQLNGYPFILLLYLYDIPDLLKRLELKILSSKEFHPLMFQMTSDHTIMLTSISCEKGEWCRAHLVTHSILVF